LDVGIISCIVFLYITKTTVKLFVLADRILTVAIMLEYCARPSVRPSVVCL